MKLIRSVASALVVLSLVFGISWPVRAQSSYEQDIIALLESTNALRVSNQMFQTMRPAWEQQIAVAFPKMPEAARTVMLDQMTATFVAEQQGLVKLIIEIYKRHFTHADIKAALAFYQTPIGRKMAEKLPILAQEGTAAGMRWGQSIAPKASRAAMQKLIDMGYDVNSFR